MTPPFSAAEPGPTSAASPSAAADRRRRDDSSPSISASPTNWRPVYRRHYDASQRSPPRRRRPPRRLAFPATRSMSGWKAASTRFCARCAPRLAAGRSRSPGDRASTSPRACCCDAPIRPRRSATSIYDGRRQDLAFEKTAGISPRERHHVRFWLALDKGDSGPAAVARLGDLRPQRRRQPLHRPGDASHRARH